MSPALSPSSEASACAAAESVPISPNEAQPSFNVHTAAKTDKNLRKYFKQPAVQKLVQQNNPRRESILGWVDDRFYAKNPLREYNNVRNEQWQGGHCKELVAGHTVDWPRETGGIQKKRSTIEEQMLGRCFVVVVLFWNWSICLSV